VIYFQSGTCPRFRRDDARIGLYWIAKITRVNLNALLLIGLLVLGYSNPDNASGQDQEQSVNTQRSIVGGTVVNSVTHQPIGRALVSSSDNRYAMLTDSEGHFEFSVPGAQAEGELAVFLGTPGDRWTGNAGLPRLRARKPGFLDDANSDRTVGVSASGEITISLAPEALIVGRITLSTSDPARNVTVEILSREVQQGILRWMPKGSTQTNSDGEFRFAELPAGSYKLLTHELMDNDPITALPGGQQYGFPPAYYPGAVDLAASGAIQLTAGDTYHVDLSLVREPYYPVHIPVANAQQSNGLNILVALQGHEGPGYSLGYRRITQRIEGLLPNGNYLLEAMGFGENSVSGMLNIKVAGGPVEGPSMALTPNGLIILNVKEEFSDTGEISGSWSNGKQTFSYQGPRAYLQASVMSADDFGPRRGGSIAPPTKPNDDFLTIRDLVPGRYWLELSSGRGYVAAATMAGVDLLHQPLVVGAGTNAQVDITVRDDTAEVEGTVEGVGGVAAAGATAHMGNRSAPAYVYCVPLPDSAGQLAQAGVSEDGKFASQRMAPGTYRMMAFKHPLPNLPYRDAEAMHAYETKGQVVHLSAGQKASVRLQVVSDE
jgi:Carboxypeptidase regulatory-like domain